MGLVGAYTALLALLEGTFYTCTAHDLGIIKREESYDRRKRDLCHIYV